MKCELCHRNDAETVLYRTGKKGRREELYVCRACAERERAFGQERGVQVAAVEADGLPGGGDAEGNGPGGIAPQELLGRLGELFGALSQRLGEEGDGETRCPGCGMTLADFRAQGMLGCPKCFKAFPKALRALLDETQQCHAYRGDALPGQARAETLRDLRRRLDEAVAREDYREAKRLREAIRELTGEGGGDGA